MVATNLSGTPVSQLSLAKPTTDTNAVATTQAAPVQPPPKNVTPDNTNAQTTPIIGAGQATDHYLGAQNFLTTTQTGMVQQAQNNTNQQAQNQANAQTTQGQPTNGTNQPVNQVTGSNTPDNSDLTNALNGATNALNDQSGVNSVNQAQKDAQNKLDEETGPLNDEKKQIQNKLNTISQENDTGYQNFQSQIDQIKNGTFPLTPVQQSLLNQTQQAVNSLYQSAQQQAQIYSQAATTYGAVHGLAEFNPGSALQEVSAAMAQGTATIAKAEMDGTKQIADLQKGFQDDDFALISKSYDAFTANQDKKQKALESVQTDVNNAIKDYKQDYADNVSNAFKSASLSDDEKKTVFDQAMQSATFDEKQKMDIEQTWKDQQDVKIQQQDQSIKSAQLSLDKAKFGLEQQKESFTEQQAANPLGLSSTGDSTANVPVQTAQDIVKQLNFPSALGATYFDPTQFSDPKQKSAAENIARQLGIPILSDATDRTAVDGLQSAWNNLNNIEQSFNKLASNNAFSSKMKNITGPIGKFIDTDTGSLLKAYQQNRDYLFQQISALAGSHPRLNAQELMQAANAMPKLDEFNYDTLKDGANKLELTRGFLSNAMKTVLPDYNPPFKGGQQYSSLQQWVGAYPKDSDLQNKIQTMKDQGLSSDDMLQILNGQ